jgi:hypothetical protein
MFKDATSVFFGEEHEVYEKLKFNLKYCLDIGIILEQMQLAKIFMDNMLSETQKSLIYFNKWNLISRPEDCKLDEPYMHHLIINAIHKDLSEAKSKMSPFKDTAVDRLDSTP